MKRETHSSRLRFGLFEVDLEERLLTKRGRRRKLHGQAFEVLSALLERPGRVVTTEELRKRLWPDGTFVDFDHSIREAVLKVRRTLDDSAVNPRFIETVPREGYRFIAPIEVRPAGDYEKQAGWRIPGVLRRGWPILLVLAALGPYWLAYKPGRPPEVPLRRVPVTSEPGSEWAGSFSPDGRQLAYFYCEPGLWIEDGNCDVYIKLLGTDEKIRLTDDPLREEFAEWSPDGRWIAFLRHDATRRAAYFLISPRGGREVKLVDFEEPGVLVFFAFGRIASWFPDSQSLVVTRKPSTQEPLSLYLVRLDGDEPFRLTHPEPGSLGDGGPAVSPDGHRLIFTRVDGTSQNLFLLELSGNSELSGKPVQLTFDGKRRLGVVWAPNGREVIYACDGILWRMPVGATQAGEPRGLALPDNRIWSPVVHADGKQLAYTSGVGGWNNLWQVELSRADHVIGEPFEMARSTRNDRSPAFSPDGKYVAFVSDRSGTEELWRCDTDGTNVVRLTSEQFRRLFELPEVPAAGSFISNVAWSPDGSRIAFGANTGSNIDIYVVSANGGIPERKSSGPFHHLPTAWSPDGEWLHFVSNREGQSESWRFNLDGGGPEKTFSEPGFPVFGSRAAEGFYVSQATRPEHASLWKVEDENNRKIKVLDSVFRGNLAIRDSGVYFIPSRDLDCRCYHLQYLDWSTGEVTTLLDLETVGDGLSVSPDGCSLVFTMPSAEGVDIMLVENFEWD